MKEKGVFVDVKREDKKEKEREMRERDCADRNRQRSAEEPARLFIPQDR